MTAIDHHLKTQQDGSGQRGCESSHEHGVRLQSAQCSEGVITQRLTPQDTEQLAQAVNLLRQPDYQEFIRILETLLARLLQLRYSSSALSCRQEQDIVDSRNQLTRRLIDHQYLNTQLESALHIAYGNARYSAPADVNGGSENLPERCPFLPEQILDQNFLPSRGL